MSGDVLNGVGWACALLSVVFIVAIVLGWVSTLPGPMQISMMLLMVFGGAAICLGFSIGYEGG